MDPRYWSGPGLIQALNDRSRQRGWLMPKEISNPVGYLVHLLKDLDPAGAGLAYHRPSRRHEAVQAVQAALAALEVRNSAKHLAEQRAGWRRVREMLRQGVGQ